MQEYWMVFENWRNRGMDNGVSSVRNGGAKRALDPRSYRGSKSSGADKSHSNKYLTDEGGSRFILGTGHQQGAPAAILKST